MRTHTRNTLADFGKKLKASDMAQIIETARGRIPFARPWISQSYTEIQAGIISDDIGIPKDMIAKALDKKDHQAMAGEINTWISNASKADRYTAICDALLARSESVDSDARWANAYATLVTKVFEVPSAFGLDAMQTPAQKEQRWGLLVAKATADRILTAAR